MRWVFLGTLLLSLGAGCSGDRSLRLGEPDPSVTRAGPVDRAGSPDPSGGASPDSEYRPGDRVDLGSADVVLAGPEHTQAGFTVAMPGDMDGDGFADMVVSNSALRNEDARVRHAVHVIYGGEDLDPARALGDADATLLTPWLRGGGGDQPWIEPAGDVDGDGLADLLVGVPGFARDVGRAFIVYGSRTRPTGEVPLAEVATVLDDGVPAGRFGARVAGLGDIDGDGIDDIGIVAFGVDASGPSDSAVHIFYGRPGQIPSGAEADALLRRAEGGLVSSYIATAGNVDKDQYDDFLVESSNADSPRTYLVKGSNVRLSGEVSIDDVGTRIEEMGITSAGGTVGDLDGDELSDFLVAPSSPTFIGHLFHGDISRYEEDFAADAAAAQVVADDESPGWETIRAAGDTNGDGAADYLIGRPGAAERRGAVHLVLGDGSRPSGRVDLASRAVTFIGRAGRTGDDETTVYDEAGSSLGAGHDVNGDGLDDFIVGAAGNAIRDVTGGFAYVVFGRAD